MKEGRNLGTQGTLNLIKSKDIIFIEVKNRLMMINLDTIIKMVLKSREVKKVEKEKKQMQ